MKRVFLSLLCILVMVPFFTSCENNDVNEETAQEIELGRFATDKGDVTGPGGGGDDDDDERP